MPLTLSGTNGVSGVDGSNTTPSVRGGTSASNGVFYGTNTVSVATNGVERTRVDSSGNLNFITADTGIIFNKTGALVNSTLNDYETGTFTPTITYGTPGTLSVSYSQQVGKYTKIGNIVKIHIFIVISAFTKGTASGELRIAGLPFASGGSGEEMMTWGAYDTPLPSAAGQFPMAAVNPSNTYMLLYYMTNNSTSVPNWGDPDANSQYKITGVYLAS